MNIFSLSLELAGVDSNEWTTIFKLDDVGLLDPMTGIQNTEVSGGISHSYGSSMVSGQQQQPAPIDRWLVEETQKLERQQRIQQQKLLELQQVHIY